MTPTLYRDTGYSLTHLVEDIKHGNIALPDISRDFDADVSSAGSVVTGFLVTQAVILATIYLSITVITGFAGQISLCQGTFAAIGGFSVYQLADRYGERFRVPAALRERARQGEQYSDQA